MKATALTRNVRSLLTLFCSTACGIEGIDKNLFEEPPDPVGVAGIDGTGGKAASQVGGRQSLVRPHDEGGRGGVGSIDPNDSAAEPGGAGGEGGAASSERPPGNKPPMGGGSAGGSSGRGGTSGSAATGGKATKPGTAGAGGSEPSAGAGAGGFENGGAGGADPGPVAALLFTEYMEGSSYNKALELTALAGGSLKGCVIDVFLTGIKGASIELTGTLAAGGSYVVCDRQLALEGARCDVRAALRFNGNDPIVLTCRGEVVDSIGSRTNPPLESWGDQGVVTIDSTLRRRCEIQDGDRDPEDPFAPELEWSAAPIDTFDDLGKHCVPVLEPEPDANLD